MSTQLLVNVIRVPAAPATLAPGATYTVEHGLYSNQKSIAPKLVQPNWATNIVVQSVTDTTITFRNDSLTEAQTADFRCEVGLSNEVDYATLEPSYWQGASIGGGGGGGSIVLVQGTAPVNVTGGLGPVTTVSLASSANFSTAGGVLDLSTTVGGSAGTYGDIAAEPESIVPVFTVDAKGRLTAVAQGAIQIGGEPAKTYVDQQDAATLAAAEAYAQSLAFGIATKAPAHVATTGPLETCVADGTFQTLTKVGPGIFPDIDGEEVVVGERVLVKDEVNAANNGIYELTTKGTALVPWVLTRTADADSAATLCGSLVTVQTGATNAGTVWIFAANPGSFTLGIDDVEWTSLQVAAATDSSLGTVQLTSLSGIGGTGSSAVDVKLHVGPEGVGSGTLPANHGGTGQSSYAQGDLLVGSVASDLDVLPVGPDNTFLRSDGTTPSWASVDLGTDDVTGVLTADKGGTGLAGSGLTAGKFLESVGDGTWQLGTAVVPGQTAIENVLFVTMDGDDATGDGSIAKPFATIQGAHAWAVANIAPLTPVVISVAPGSYPGPTLSRLNTFVQGAATKPEEKAATRLTNVVSIVPATSGSKYNTQIGIAGFFIDGGSTGSAISSISLNPCTVEIVNCYLTNSSSVEPVVVLDNDNGKFLFYTNVVDAQYVGTYAINSFSLLGGDIRASDNYLKHGGPTGGLGSVLSVAGTAYGLFDRMLIESKLAKCVVVAGTYTGSSFKVVLANSSVTSSNVGAAGVTFTTTSGTSLVTDTTFGVGGATIAAGTSSVMYANIVCLAPTVPSFTGSALTAANEAHGSITIPSLASASKPLKADANKKLVTGDILLTSEVSGTLPVGNGGTGQSVVAKGSILYGDTATALGVLAPGTDGWVLTTKGPGLAPVWSTMTVGTVTSITLDTGSTNATGLTVNNLTSDTITNAGTFALGGKLATGFGGTNSTATPVDGGVAYGASGAYAFSAAGASGSILTSAGAGTPTWTTVLPVANGGTGVSSVGASGTVAYSNGTTYAFTATGVDDQILRLVSGVPTWSANTSTPTGPASGDLSGNFPSPTVAAVKGTAITTAGGALTVGLPLVTTGVASADWAALNLAGSGVTGVLPKANQADQDMGGDVSGTTGVATVTKVQGNAFDASVPTTGQVPTWNSTLNKFVYSVPSGGGGGGGGGSGALYYFDASSTWPAPTPGLPATTREMTKIDPVSSTNVTSGTLTGSYAYVTSFVTDVAVPSLSPTIPSGLWNFNLWADSTASTNEASIRALLYKYDGATTTLVATSADVFLSSPAVPTLLDVQMVIPVGVAIAETDRLYVVVEAKCTTVSKTLTAYFGGSYPSHVHTTLPEVSGTGFVQVVADVVQPTAAKIPLGSTTYVDGTLLPGNGGTGNTATPTLNGLAYGDGTKITYTAAGTTGQYLYVDAGGLPAWTNVSFGNVSSITAGTGLTGGTITTSGTIAADFGTASGKIAEGNDTRFNPAPSGAGKIVYDNGTAYVALAAATGPTATNQVLHGGATPSWSLVSLDNDTTGNLNTDRGGTGLTSYAAGDMVYWASGTAFTKLGIGSTAGSVLTSTGTAPQWSALLQVTANNVLVNNNARLVTKPQTAVNVSSLAYQFTALSSMIEIASISTGGTLTASPTILTSGIAEGTRLTIVNTTAQTITFRDDATLPSGSGIQLGGVSERSVGPWQAINFIFSSDGVNSYWVETAIGGSGVVQSVGATNGLITIGGSSAVPTVGITGLTSASPGTTNGIPYFDSATSMASSVALTANRLVVGGASGPAPLAAGTSGYLLTSNGTGSAPSFNQLNLGTSAAITGTLDVGNGGTGASTLTSNGVLLGNGTSAVQVTAAGSANTVLRVGSGGGAPSFGSIDLASSSAVSGLLGKTNGGTGVDNTSVAQNYVFAGPATGGTGAAEFRALVAADIPPIAASGVTGIPYDIAGNAAGTPSPSLPLFYFKAVRNCTIAATGHQGGCRGNPAASTSVQFDVQVNGVSIGIFTINDLGAFSSSITATALGIGDVVTVVAPPALNGIVDPYFTFVATVG